MIPRPPTTETTRALDRALSYGVLEDTCRVANMDIPHDVRSELLTVALRNHTTPEDARNKLKKTVTRVWLNPPTPAVGMIQWAMQHPEAFPDRRVVHAGALLATTPFLAGIFGVLGRQFALGEAPTVPDLRRRAEAQWGSSSTVKEGVGKAITTLRRLDIVTGGGRIAVVATTKMSAGREASAWLVHATMLARQVQSLDYLMAMQAPELFWVGLATPTAAYPYLESHSEGIGRRVWATC